MQVIAMTAHITEKISQMIDQIISEGTIQIVRKKEIIIVLVSNVMIGEDFLHSVDNQDLATGKDLDQDQLKEEIIIRTEGNQGRILLLVGAGMLSQSFFPVLFFLFTLDYRLFELRLLSYITKMHFRLNLLFILITSRQMPKNSYIPCFLIFFLYSFVLQKI